jgi:hypothetical protein
MPTFVAPLVEDLVWVNAETPPLARRLFRYYDSFRGRSVVLVDGHYVVMDNPDQLLLAGLTEGVDYFLGGHVYQVTDEVAAALVTDGLEVGTSMTWTQMGAGTWDSYGNDLWGTVD